MSATVDLTRRKTPFTLSDVLARQQAVGGVRLRLRDDQREHLFALLREVYGPLKFEGTVTWNGMEVVK